MRCTRPTLRPVNGGEDVQRAVKLEQLDLRIASARE
jgi:hypothetical protein